MADQNDLREMKFKEMEERLQRKERKLDLFQAQTLELSEAFVSMGSRRTGIDLAAYAETGVSPIMTIA